jgi:hypothetical protein
MIGNFIFFKVFKGPTFPLHSGSMWTLFLVLVLVKSGRNHREGSYPKPVLLYGKYAIGTTYSRLKFRPMSWRIFSNDGALNNKYGVRDLL